jgi:hypothetical protein
MYQSFKDMLLTPYPEKWRSGLVHSVYIILSHYMVVTSQTTALFTATAMKTLYAQLVYTELTDSIPAITEHSDIPH